MTITPVQGNQVNSSVSVTSQAITLGAGVTQGNLLVASVTVGSNTTSITGPSGGWTQAIINNPAGSNALVDTSIWWTVVSAGQAGQTSWTWTFGASHTVYMCIKEWSSTNGWPASPMDQTAQGDTAGTPVQATTIVSGTTSTTTQASELWIASLAYKGTAQTESSITSGWTKDLESTISGNTTMTMLYQVALSTGTAACQYTIGTAQYWAGCIATFKDNPPNPALSTSPTTLSFSASVGGSNPASQNDTLSETHNIGTNWTSNISYGSGSGWLGISPTTGTLAGSGNQTITVSCTTGSLVVGTYTATVTFTAVTGGATATIGVTFVITIPTPVLSTSPTTLSFSSATGGGNPPSQNDTLSETAGAATSWTSSINYGSGSGWLGISPSFGSLSANGNQVVVFSCTTGALTAATYTATVTFTAVTGGATATVTVSFIIAAASRIITAGQFGLYANGTGTASFDHLRVTQYPDPSLSLAPVLPRIGTSLAAWNAVTPPNTTLGVDISYDGVNWTDDTSSNGGSLPTIYSQPVPTVDGFSTNTSANYTSANRAGGATATVAYDLANDRLIMTGGTNAFYLNSSINRADVDFFADLDRSDAGGLVWRYVNNTNFYYLVINDSLSSTGVKNTITLYRVVANVQTVLGTAVISYVVGTSTSSYIVTFTHGTYRRFRVTMLGGVIICYVDGVQMITATDGSPLGAGLMGLYNNGGTTGSRYYQLWLQPIGDSVTGTPAGDTVTGKFVYTRLRLATTDPTVTPQVLDVTTTGFSPNIQAGTTIPNVAYNATSIAKNYDDLAKQSNYSWYIDQNKNLIFRSTATVAAPWILQSSPAGLVQTVDLEVSTNLELDVQNDLYRNRQIIIGAIATLTASATFAGDGSTRQFTLGYPLNSAPTILLNGVVQTIGLKGSTGFQFYWATGDAVLEQDASGVVLQKTDQLSVANYTGQYITNVTVDNVAAQAAQALIEGSTGIVENVEDDTTLKLSLADATTRANQLLARYSTLGRTLIFDTSRDGLAVGQTLSIFFPEEGIIDGQFYINQVEITLRKNVNDAQIWWYKVTCSELPRQASWAKLIASGLSLQ